MNQHTKTNNKIRHINAGISRKNELLPKKDWTKAVKEISSEDLVRTLRAKGISYKYQNMLKDIRRKDSTARATTPEARKNSLNWFDNVFEPFRKKHDYNSKQASEMWDRSVKQSYETKEQAELGTDLSEVYELIKKGMSPDDAWQKVKAKQKRKKKSRQTKIVS